VVKHAGHIKGILAQKPLGLNYLEAKEDAQFCQERAITLAVVTDRSAAPAKIFDWVAEAYRETSKLMQGLGIPG
jgi:hypothetical protein